MNDDSRFSLIFYAAIGVLILLCIAAGACNVSDQECRRILYQEGVTGIQLSGHAWFACSEDDAFSTAFSGVRNGVRVKGAVCGGFLKNYTVRYE